MSDKKKILFLIPNLGKGGAERILAHLLNHLNRDLFSLGCIFFDDKHAHPIPADVSVFDINLPGTPNIAKKIFRYIHRIMKIKKILDSYKPDCFFSFMENTPAVLSVRFSSLKPFCVISIHSPLEHEERGIKRILAKIFYSHADHIIAVSEGVKSILIQKFALPAEKISAINNPIDISAINRLKEEPIAELDWFNDRVPVIITAGRLKPEKGHEYLLKAFALLSNRLSARLVILGEGQEEPRLKRMVQSLHLEHNVRFLGFQPNPFSFLARSTVFVLPSIFEGFGNVIVEAMACGVPVIATDCPVGPREIIQNNVNGILVPPKNTELLAEAIFALLSCKNDRDRFSHNALKNLHQYDVGTIVSRYEKVLAGNG